jgi:hypothetical protein
MRCVLPADAPAYAVDSVLIGLLYARLAGFARTVSRMRSTRVLTLNEARVGFCPSPRRREPRPRAEVLASDPSWLHDGPTVRLTSGGREIDLFGMTIMCRAIRRGPKSVRELIGKGVLPDARYRTAGRDVRGQHRLWRREELLAVWDAASELDVLDARPARWQDVPLLERIRAHLATA